ncbi:MAG TPA: ATP-binding protein [Roseiflexaceae bacterium]|nr:ATP-binding protein [Roseiflexaceae bacterium]
MRVNELLGLITQGTLLLIAVLTLLDLFRYRDQARIDIALIFGALAAIVLIQGLATVTRQQVPWAGQLGAILLVAQPFLLLRLVQHFRFVPRVVRWVASASMAISCITLIAIPAPLPPPLALLLVILFVSVEGYAAVAFVRGALHAEGVTHHRLLLAASGSGLLASVILLAGLNIALPSGTGIITPLSQILALLCMLSYYLGFVPPHWLRTAWQLVELQRFLRAVAGRTASERAPTTLNQLCRMGTRAVGGLAAAVALHDKTGEMLTIHASSGHPALAGDLRANSGTLGRAWTERQPMIARTQADFGVDVVPLAAAVGASALLIVPIATTEHAWGVLIVFMYRGPLFAIDDLNLLALFTEQSAIALDYAALLEEQQAVVMQLRQRTEQLSASNQALEQASLTKDRFLSSMSHELRTPLNAIIGFTGTLLMRLPGPLTTDQEKQLRTIQRSSQHLLALINDILDLAKIESGRVDMELEPLACQAIINEVVASLRPLAEQKGLQLIVDCPAETIVVQTNHRALSQILINLINNAIKFTPHGSVRLTLGQLLAQEGRQIEIQVADTGIGIRAEDQRRLFQLFTQVDNAETRVQEGTGLGLHLSQKLAGLLGGQITVKSVLGQGSTFTLHLPATG